VNANGDSTVVTFEYGLDTGYGTIVTANPNPVSGTTDTPVSVSLNTLLPNTTYHYRVSGTNSFGTSNGADMTFTTLPSPPTATTNPASPVSNTTATLNGTVNANDSSSIVTFEYGLDTSYGSTVTAVQSPVTGSTDTAVSRAISGLTNGVTYHYRVVATNAGGTTNGADMTFTTGIPAPTATTNPASGISSTSATLNGTVNANNSSTTVTFEYGETVAYGRTAVAVQSPVTGSTSTAVSAAISSLVPNTLYHYRVKAESVGGTTYGTDMTFTTVGAPIVITLPATPVSPTGATLNGTVNANGYSTTVTFEYGTTASYGTTVTADQSPVTGTTPTAVSTSITGLTPGNTYHYRVVGQNAQGTTYGADMTFIASAPGAPTATTDPASFLFQDGATLNGTVNANNAVTTVTFEYGLTPAYGSTVPSVPGTVLGSADTPVSVPITGLTLGNTYHYRVVAVNVNGTTYGADMTFTTTTAPIAVTGVATGLGATSATLTGIANANYDTGTVVGFQYYVSLPTVFTAVATPGTISGSTNFPITANLTGLTPNTTYTYYIYAQNSLFPAQTTYGAQMTFTTLPADTAPTAVTDPASAVGGTTVTLNGTVNANNTTTTVTFEYGLDTNYGQTVTAVPSPVTGSTPTTVSSNLTTLAPNTTYHYRVVAQNTGNTVYGTDMTFTTGLLPPTADTNAASAVSSTGATLNGIVNANNDSTTVTFEYGTTPAFGTMVTADQSPVTGYSNTAVSTAITGLANNTTYHFRVAAQNSSGTTYGATMTFFTGIAPPTVTTNAATAISSTSATLNGTVNANNSSTTVTFEYGETTAYGRTVTADQSPVTGNSDTSVSVTPTDLLPNTLYHFRIVGQNASGTTYGMDMTFTTNPANTPSITTANVTNITFQSAISGGDVTGEGGAPVTSRGVCWSTVPNPTIADNFTTDGSGPGSFTSNLTGLAESTIYYVRAYATNLYGTVYGNEIQFTTNLANSPVVTTTNITNITPISATGGGNVIDEGDAPVTARGVCWSTAPNPTTANNRTSDGTGPGTFTSYLTGLSESTTYYIRAYATNLFGTGYGAEFQFTTNSASLASVLTGSVSMVTTQSARCGGTVTDDGGVPVTARGVCWSTAPNPTIANNRATNGTGLGSFTSNLTGLSEDTTYYVRAYATNSAGTAYGAQRQFTTNSTVLNITITQPASGAIISGTVTIEASASISNGQTINRVEFFINNTYLAEDTTMPYETQWDTTAVTDGSHSIAAIAYDDNNNHVQDEITVSVSNTPIIPGEININRTNLNFGSIFQNTTTTAISTDNSTTTGAQTLLINNNGGGTLNWTINKNADWLSYSPTSGAGPGAVTVSVDPSGLTLGSHSATITVTDHNTSTYKALPVNLVIYQQAETTAPFGYFETPINNSTVTGSIPVTGWVLDDIEVKSVKIYRNPMPAEGSNMVYIGDAVFVDGARPDVEATYPYYPLNYQTGWGYMLLTYGLPNQGNGAYTLYAQVTDAEGNSYSLGSKTIICDNVNAVKPFGAIDTPEQGGSVSGKSFVNFGWALTPQPNSIPTDGSTITVWVDGVPLGNPVYNQFRSDITTKFPGYNNSQGAGGHFYLDTTQYTNGVHTISWSVKDNAGNIDGIGSRYFTIINTSSQDLSNITGSTKDKTGGMNPFVIEPSLRNELIFVAQKPINLSIKELDQVTLWVEKNPVFIHGFLEINGRKDPLPIGSTLDIKNGIFFWKPGPGYKGIFPLTFYIKTSNGQIYTKSVVININ
jgi:phosphodiesterase/alkaline phosphatase D-like protein